MNAHTFELDGAPRVSKASSKPREASRIERKIDWRDWRWIGWVYVAGFLTAFGLKLFYSRAGADELAWILGPTARLAELLGSVHFEWESRTGWISRSSRMILEPACAGVNFLIICFSMLFFTYAGRLHRWVGRWAWLGLALGLSYLLTLLTNSVRILVAIKLHDMDLTGQWLTAQRIHRAEGTVVYLISLLAIYLVAEAIAARLDERLTPPSAGFPLAPIGWYALIALGVPLLNRAYARGAEFFEHAALVLSICLLLSLLYVGWRLLLHRMRPMMKAFRASDQRRGKEAPPPRRPITGLGARSKC